MDGWEVSVCPHGVGVGRNSFCPTFHRLVTREPGNFEQEVVFISVGGALAPSSRIATHFQITENADPQRQRNEHRAQNLCKKHEGNN